MATVRPRTLRFEVALDRDWSAASDREGEPLRAEEGWSPEHLLLVALARCVLTSLRYHAKRAGVSVESSASAGGAVTKRETDGRYAFVEIAVDAEVELDPPVEGDALRALLAKAERDCFVGATLTVTPDYRWTVAGKEVV